MSLIPFDVMPRSMLDMDTWFRPTLDLFDPFDVVDRALSRNLQWLDWPSFMEPIKPIVPRKYRVTVDCAGYEPKSVKTEIQNKNLIVSGKEDVKEQSGDYSTKEFRKTYKLPDNAETEKLVSFMTPLGQLVVEVPLKEEGQIQEDLFPRIVDKPEGGKQMSMKCSVPQGVDPTKISVTCKDRDLIIKAEDVKERPDSVSRMHYYKRCTLPENTDFNSLKCRFQNNQLEIEAPIQPGLSFQRQYPIEYSK